MLHITVSISSARRIINRNFFCYLFGYFTNPPSRDFTAYGLFIQPFETEFLKPSKKQSRDRKSAGRLPAGAASA